MTDSQVLDGRPAGANCTELSRSVTLSAANQQRACVIDIMTELRLASYDVLECRDVQRLDR